MKKRWKGSKNKLLFYRPFLTGRPNVRLFFDLLRAKLRMLQKRPPFIWFNTGRELNQLAVSLSERVYSFPTFTSPDLIKVAAHLQYLDQSLASCRDSVNRILTADIFPLILVTPDENRIEAINGAFLEIIGYTKDEIIGRTLGELEIWATSEQCSRFILTIRGKKPVFNSELQFYHRNRQLITEIVNAVPITLYDTEYLLISFKDITDQKQILSQLQQSYADVTEILDGISDVFFALNSNWVITYVNTLEPFFLNRKREDLLGKNIWDTFPTLQGTIFQQELFQAMQDKKPAHFEAPSLLGDQWYQIDTYPLKDGISVFGRNITSQKRIMEALQRSNQQIVAIMDNIPEAFFQLDNNWRFIYLNKQAERHFERSREELIGKRIWAQIPRLAGSQMAAQFYKANSEHTPVFYEGPSPLSGQYYEFHLFPTSDGLTVSMLNINERKLKEEAQAKAEERFSHILNNIGNPVLVLDQNWQIIYVNPEMERCLKKAAPECLDKYIWDIIPEFTASALYQRLHCVLEQHQPACFEEFFSITNCWMEFNVFTSGSDLVVCLKDISERKKYETELQHYQHRLTTILESINDAFFTLDSHWRFTSLNRMAESLWQKNQTQLSGKVIWNEFPQLVRTVVEREFHLAVKEKKGVHFEAFLSGINIWLEIDAHPDENGLSVYCRDISLRKRLESSSATERELLLITLRSIGDGVIAANRAGQVILLNQTAEELTGWTYDEAVGQPLNKVFYVINDKTSEPYDNIVSLTIETGETTELANAVLVNRNFKEIMLSNSCAPIRSGEGDVLGVVMVFQDITEKLKTEAELLKAHKIESLGVLAGGIAHDFNNYLAAIMANIQLSALRLEKGHDIKKSLNEAIEATKKASELTKQLLTFAKGGAPVKKSVSIANLLEETTNFHLSGSKVKPIFCIPEDLWQVEVDTGQFSQVVSNLVINAEQAMPKGGTIAIYAENITVPEGDRFKAGRYIKIAFKDYGIGISDEHLSKIFDPFFSTKKSGSGLGLATSYSIIQKHGGYIDVTTKIGAGTTFFIYLPASDNPSEAESSVEAAPLSGEGDILVMDDEEMIRNAVTEMLQLLGYQATTAQDGMEAIQLYKKAMESHKPFKAVLIDLTIPGGMGGLEAVTHLKQIDPGVKAIVSSGYANDPVMADYEKYGFCGVILKPYKIEEFSQTLNKVINLKQETPEK